MAEQFFRYNNKAKIYRTVYKHTDKKITRKVIRGD